ncbi:hypothetical protein HDU67_004945 [Dinochytrium kinnereticum]|nr:hypothetical protein HDU67_004945 [Dinochytrium kinnereticum]
MQERDADDGADGAENGIRMPRDAGSMGGLSAAHAPLGGCCVDGGDADGGRGGGGDDGGDGHRCVGASDVPSIRISHCETQESPPPGDRHRIGSPRRPAAEAPKGIPDVAGMKQHLQSSSLNLSLKGLDETPLSDQPFSHATLAVAFAKLRPEVSSSSDSITLSINPQEEEDDRTSPASPTAGPQGGLNGAPIDTSGMVWIRARSMSYGSAVPMINTRKQHTERVSTSCKHILILLCTLLAVAAVGAVIGFTGSKAR